MVALVRIDDAASDATEARITDREGEAMARAVLTLFKRWRLSDTEACVLLGDMAPRTYARWKRGAVGRVGRDLKTRMSILLGVHKALRLVFVAPEQGYQWMRRPNGAFGRRSALEVMLDGEMTDLMRVRQYLDAERGA